MGIVIDVGKEKGEFPKYGHLHYVNSLHIKNPSFNAKSFPNMIWNIDASDKKEELKVFEYDIKLVNADGTDVFTDPVKYDNSLKLEFELYV